AKERRVARLPTPAGAIWITAERLPHFQALFPAAVSEPAIAAPGALNQAEPQAPSLPRNAGEGRRAERAGGGDPRTAADNPPGGPSPDQALVETLRGRLEGLGPITPDALAAPLGLSATDIAAALAALEAEGFAMRGRFTPGTPAEEWCERRLLVRIHHYTVKRLRAEIEPVAARDFLRFLLAWQHVTAGARMEGVAAVDEVVGQLEGFEAPAAAWEAEIRRGRIARYEKAWLDERCRAGHVAGTRLRPRANEGRAAPVRTTPIALIARRHAALWAALSAKGEAPPSSSSARAVL